MSLPGGATYLGKFSQGKPVGKGRLVDLAKKKEKGKFSTMSEVLNRSTACLQSSSHLSLIC